MSRGRSDRHDFLPKLRLDVRFLPHVSATLLQFCHSMIFTTPVSLIAIVVFFS